MNRRFHERAGLAAGVAGAAYHARNLDMRDATPELIGALLWSSTAGRLSDILEPAHHPRHRDVAHSGAALAGAAYFALSESSVLAQTQKDLRALADQQRLLAELSNSKAERAIRSVGGFLLRALSGALSATPAAYASHLVADSQTPASIPIISRRLG